MVFNFNQKISTYLAFLIIILLTVILVGGFFIYQYFWQKAEKAFQADVFQKENSGKEKDLRFVEIEEEYQPDREYHRDYMDYSYFFKINENQTIEVEPLNKDVDNNVFSIRGRVWLVEDNKKTPLIEEVYPYNLGGFGISVFRLNIPEIILITESLSAEWSYQKIDLYINLNNKKIILELNDFDGFSITINEKFEISPFVEGKCNKEDDDVLIKGVSLNGEYIDIGFEPKIAKCIHYGEGIVKSIYVPYGEVKIDKITTNFSKIYLKFIEYNGLNEIVWQKNLLFDLENQKLIPQ